MTKLRFKLLSELSTADALNRIADLFRYESIKFTSGINSIKSKSIPLPVVSFDRRHYSRKNWVGINPFIFISSIEIVLEPQDAKRLRIEVNIDKSRAILIFIAILLLSGLVALNLPGLLMAISLFIIVFALSYFYIFRLCIQHLIKKEISDAVTCA